MNNLILCGFMGCGKTTVGRQLSRRLRWEYIDLDAQIEREAGMPIPEIFSRFGESYFRGLEHEAVAGLAKRVNCVVSTGGGALTDPRNIAALDARDLVIFLDAPFAACYARIRGSDRPIVRQKTPAQLEELFERRRPFYLQASGLVVDGGLSARDAAAEILRRTGNGG